MVRVGVEEITPCRERGGTGLGYQRKTIEFDGGFAEDPVPRKDCRIT